jgi:hypothetical protein
VKRFLPKPYGPSDVIQLDGTLPVQGQPTIADSHKVYYGIYLYIERSGI